MEANLSFTKKMPKTKYRIKNKRLVKNMKEWQMSLSIPLLYFGPPPPKKKSVDFFIYFLDERFLQPQNSLL